MSSIDTRVVEMQFDNQQFEKGVQTSVKSLDDLKKGLDLEKSAKGLAALESAGKSFSLSGIANSVSTIEGRFTSLGIVGVTALENITNSAINAGKQMLKSLTIDPVSSGFSKYEKETTSVQAIMNATGEGVDTVEGKIAKLGWFTDETSYNYSTMVDTLGKFVAAGSGLDESITAMEGIATAGALAGVSIDKTSMAYYNLSQAMAAGKVSAIDWKSIELAGMATKKFKQDAIDAAVASGTVIDLGDGNYISASDKATANKTKNKSKRNDQIKKKSFTADSMGDHLESGWFDKNVLMTTLNKYGEYADAVYKVVKEQNVTTQEAMDIVDKNTELWDDPFKAAQEAKTFTDAVNSVKDAVSTGWKDTFKTVFGNYEEAKVLWTDLAGYLLDIFAESGNERNKMLQAWKDLGGRNDLTDAFYNIMDSLENIIATVKGAISEIFPPMTADVLKNMTAGIDAFTVKIKAFTENTDKMDKVKSIFKGIAAVVDNVRMALSWLWDGFKKLIGIAAPAGGSILDLAAKVGDYLVAFHDAIKTSKTFQDILTTVGKVIVSVRGFVVRAGQAIGKVFSDLFEKLKNTGIFKKIGNGVSTFLGKIPEAIETLERWGKAVVAYIQSSGSLQKAWSKITDFLNPVIGKIKEFAKKFRDAIKALFGAGTSGGQGFGDKLKAGSTAFKDAFAQWFAGTKEKLSIIWGKAKEFFIVFFGKTVPSFFNSLVGKIGNAFQQIKGIDIVSILKTALGLYAGFKIASFLGSFAKIGAGFKGIGKALDVLGTDIKQLTKNGLSIIHKNKDSLGTTLLKIAAAIGILVASLYVLSKMDNGQIVKGLGVIGMLAVELGVMSLMFRKVDGKAFLGAAAAILALTIPIKILGSMDTKTAIKGIVGIGVILTELALFMRMTSGTGFAKKTAFLSMAISLNLLVLAVKNLSKLQTDEILKGMVSLEVLFLMLSRFIKKTGSLGKVSGLLGMAIAINLLVFAVKRLGNIKTKTLVKGISALSGIFFSIGLLTKSAGVGSFKKSILILLTTAGMLLLFVDAFKQLDGIKADSMLSFSASMSSILLALSGTMYLLSKIQPSAMLAGIANLGMLVAAIAVIVIALGELQNTWTGMSGVLTAGGDVLGLLGRAIGMFVGGLIGGIGEGMSGSLPQIGTDLSTFMTNLQPFIEGVKNVDDSVKTCIESLAAALTAMTNTELWAAVGSAFLNGENPIVKFGGDILLLADSLKAYAEHIKGFTAIAPDDVAASTDSATALAKLMAAIPSSGGLTSWISGIKDVGDFGDDLTSLAIGLKTYSSSIKGFSTDSNLASQSDINSANAAATGLAALENSLTAKGGVVQNWSGVKSLRDFGSELKGFGTGLKNYASEVKDFPAADENGIANALATAQGLASLESSLEAKDGMLQDLVGVRSLANFKNELTGFGTALSNYAQEVKKVPAADSKGSKNALDTATSLAALENSLTTQGGDWQDFAGVKSLANFGGELPAFGAALKAYATGISGFSTTVSQTDVDNAINTAIAIAGVNSALPFTGGQWQVLTGQQDLGTFSDNVTEIGVALKSFATNIGGVDSTSSDKAITTITSIKNFIDELKVKNGLFNDLGNFFSGTESGTLLAYTSTMKTVGENLKSFSDNIGAVDPSGADKASKAFDPVIAFIQSLDASGGFFEVFGEVFTGNKETTLKTASAAMAAFGSDLKTFSDGITGAVTAEANFEAAKRLFAAFKAFNDEVAGYGDINYSDQMKDLLWILGDFGSALSEFGLTLTGVDVTTLSSAANIIKTLVTIAGMASGITADDVSSVQTILNGFSALVLPDFTTSGGDTATAFLNGLTSGIQNGTKTIATAAKNLATNGCGNARMAYPNWYTTGQYLAQGLGNGISSMAGRVRNAAVNVAAGAIRSIQMTWSVHSPSKVGNDLGMYFDLGIAGGLDGYSKVVTQSAADVGKNATESAKAMLGSFTANAIDGMDTAPTIRPVIDMGDVTNGVNAINGLFNANQSLNAGIFTGATFNRNAAKINMDGGRQTGTGDNRDVVNAIGTLTARFDNLSDAVANMKLVLDTGTLVGQMGAKMDKQLGVLAGRRDRGN